MIISQIPVSLLRKILVFSMPFVIAFLTLTGMLMYIGESMPIEWVVRLQDQDAPILYRVKYGNIDQRYKLTATNYHQPEVLILGSSRMLQFRDVFLNNDRNTFRHVVM